MRSLPQPRHKQAVLYLVLIVLTAAIAVGLRACPRHSVQAEQTEIEVDSVRYVPVYTIRE